MDIRCGFTYNIDLYDVMVDNIKEVKCGKWSEYAYVI
jgi:hypothetical protein